MGARISAVKVSSRLQPKTDSGDVTASSLGFAVNACALILGGFLVFRFPHAFYKRYGSNLHKPVPEWVPTYNRAFGSAFILAGFALVLAAVFVIR